MIQSYTHNSAQNLRQNFDALVSAYDIHYFTNIATQRENWQNLKKLIICAAYYLNDLVFRFWFTYFVLQKISEILRNLHFVKS